MPSLELIKYEEDLGDNEVSWEDGVDTSRPLNVPNSDKRTVIKLKQSQINEAGEKEKMKLQVMGTMFSAFKFPDTASLHLRCLLEICRKTCQTVRNSFKKY